MSPRVVRMLSDDQTIIQKVADVTIETTSQLRQDEWRAWKDRLHAVVGERLIANRLQDGANDVMASMMDLAARLGFFLAFTVASHGPLGDRA